MTLNLDLLRINKFVLGKQKLAGTAPSQNIVETVRAVGGLHATGAATPYLSLFARVAGFKREHLDYELYVKRSLGKVRYVRTTVYVLPRDIIPTAFAATNAMSEPASQAYSRFIGVTEQQYKETSERITRVLKGTNGMSAREIKESVQTSLNVSPIVNLMCDQGLLIRGAPEKGWKSNLHKYHLFNEYFPDVKLDEKNEKDARKAVVRWYLASFGPATENDLTWWTGFPKSQVRRILNDLENDVAYVNVSDLDKTLIMLSKDKARLKLVRREGKPVINLLPSLDPYLMGYKDRERYIDAEHYDFIFDRSGNATSTILVDGEVIGVWDFEDPVVKIFLFRDNKADLAGEIHHRAIRLGAFFSGRQSETRDCTSMIPLKQRAAGGVVSPLRSC